MSTITCARCAKAKEAFERAPFPGAIGARVLEGTCRDCWADWLKQQTMLINHYGLNVMDPQARQFLMRNMEAFLFKAGEQDAVDTSKQGTITH
jgi:Fe-S cluster biosynthesis and repair protein YggX